MLIVTFYYILAIIKLITVHFVQWIQVHLSKQFDMKLWKKKVESDIVPTFTNGCRLSYNVHKVNKQLYMQMNIYNGDYYDHIMCLNL